MEINLLPGPVNIPNSVKNCMLNHPFSHRSSEFTLLYDEIKKLLLTLKMNHLQILQGSGTLANDIVAQQLLGIQKKGLIINNGEFGKRLVKQAQTAGLFFFELQMNENENFNIDSLEKSIKHEKFAWIWFVHSETSTGQINPLREIITLCKTHNILVAVDAISSIGNFETDFENVDFVTCTSGKGLSSFPGLSIVFYNSIVNKNVKVHYLNLNYHEEQNNIPFTLSSNQLDALFEGIKFSLNKTHFGDIQKIHNEIKKWKFDNFELLNYEKHNPAVHSFRVKNHLDSFEIGNTLSNDNIQVNYRTSYIIENNVFQLCFMGNVNKINLERVYQKLNEIDKQNFK